MLNPLLTKELRMQARNRETYVLGGIFILVLSVLVFSLLWEASTGDRPLDAEHGKNMFRAFVVVLMLAIFLISPALTVGAISSEREKLTFSQLRVTLLKPRQILVGKAAPVLAYILILLFASLPVAIVIMPLGGISLADMASCYLVAFISALAFGLIGLMCSSICRNTRASTVITYGIVALLAFGTALLDMSMFLNPFHVAFSVLRRQTQISGLSPWVIMTIGYSIVSAIAACIALLRFRKMRG